MKTILCVAVGIVVDIPDDAAGVCAPVPESLLDELTARLQDEACYGRDFSKPHFVWPNVTARVAAAYQECCDSD